MAQQASMKTSFVATVLNEERDIKSFLDSLISQSQAPDEIIIVDAGSTDRTVEMIKQFGSKLKLYVVKGNRSMGRNYGIRKSKGDVILVSDAGCILDIHWIKNITSPFSQGRVAVVSGYYYPVANSLFEKSLASYTCVMPDKVDPATFLPSSRSVAFRKSVWQEIGGYPEYLDTCEDLVFARSLKEKGFIFAFDKNAIVHWRQKENFFQAFWQFYTYAVGDGMAHYFRPQTPLLFFRYIIGIGLLLYAIITNNLFLIDVLILLFILYLLWALYKNYRYVKNVQAIFILPLLQITADSAVLAGTTVGVIKRIWVTK